jgi:N-acetylmuramic acid 6-phosphate etherase
MLGLAMTIPITETALDTYQGLDLWPGERVLSAIQTAQAGAVGGLTAALAAIVAAAEAFADAVRAGGRVIYVGAGSSGLIAQLDALELTGTFGIPMAQIRVLLAGGMANWTELQGGIEDDVVAGRTEMAALRPERRDCVIAVSASGSTPYTVAAAEAAAEAGATVIGLACNAAAPLLKGSAFAIHLATPPEVLAGSTRMNAGTAQKVALNMLSTLAALRLGHVHDGLMVNVRAENAKLRGRAAGIVARVAGCGAEEAFRLLEQADFDVKTAILMHRLGSPEAARAALAKADGHLRVALGGPATDL